MKENDIVKNIFWILILIGLGPAFAYGAAAPKLHKLTQPWRLVVSVNLEPTPVVPGHPRTVSEKISESGGIGEPIGFSPTTIYFMGESAIVKYDRQSHIFSWVPGTHFSNRWSTNSVENAAYLNGIFYVFGYNYYCHVADVKHCYGVVRKNVLWLHPSPEKDSNGYTSIKIMPNGGVSFLINSGSIHPKLLYGCSRLFTNCKKLVDDPVSSYVWGSHGHLYYVPDNNLNVLVGPKNVIQLTTTKTNGRISRLANSPIHFFKNGSFAYGNEVYNKYGMQTGLIPAPPGANRTNTYNEYWFHDHLFAKANGSLYVYNASGL